MSDFETMKKKMIEENEKNFGEEIRENYGDDVYETSNNILAGLTEEQWRRSEMLRIKAEDLLQKHSARKREQRKIKGVDV